MKAFVRLVLTVLLVVAPLSAPQAIGKTRVEVMKVYDGDTVTLKDGTRVRLVQIDAPEISGGECFATQSRDILISLIKSKNITLTLDPKLDQVDRYGRKLGYLFAGKINLNLKLVKLGAATPYFYGGDKGKYATSISKLARQAQSQSRGLWKECPGTKLNEYSALQTLNHATSGDSTGCDPNYSGCVPLGTQDLDCPDIRNLGLAPVRIIGADIHRLDRDGDGYGCE